MHRMGRVMTDRQTRAAHNQQQSIKVFLAQKAEFDSLLADLQRTSDDHFGADPETVLRGHVRTLADWKRQLRLVTDSYFSGHAGGR